jgi:hypothetical protein
MIKQEDKTRYPYMQDKSFAEKVNPSTERAECLLRRPLCKPFKGVERIIVRAGAGIGHLFGESLSI